MEIAPGAFHFARYLTIGRQRALVDRCRALVDGDVPAYVPVVRGGGRMHVRMLCLGRHWNGKTYGYEPTRADFDGLPVPPLPEDFRALASEIAADAGMALEADLCILNYYDGEGRTRGRRAADCAASGSGGHRGDARSRPAGSRAADSRNVDSGPVGPMCRRIQICGHGSWLR
ncbi:MAG: alpha-ketoglutarate-dependent dioxygenase AlkB [Acidobacteria bacterium]|nr:alpha-ketoglutarate-dependent dioxygenase AlkB [Acidobacteriota bacterium]